MIEDAFKDEWDSRGEGIPSLVVPLLTCNHDWTKGRGRKVSVFFSCVEKKRIFFEIVFTFSWRNRHIFFRWIRRCISYFECIFDSGWWFRWWCTFSLRLGHAEREPESLWSTKTSWKSFWCKSNHYRTLLEEERSGITLLQLQLHYCSYNHSGLKVENYLKHPCPLCLCSLTCIPCSKERLRPRLPSLRMMISHPKHEGMMRSWRDLSCLSFNVWRGKIGNEKEKREYYSLWWSQFLRTLRHWEDMRFAGDVVSCNSHIRESLQHSCWREHFVRERKRSICLTVYYLFMEKMTPGFDGWPKCKEEMMLTLDLPWLLRLSSRSSWSKTHDNSAPTHTLLLGFFEPHFFRFLILSPLFQTILTLSSSSSS